MNSISDTAETQDADQDADLKARRSFAAHLFSPIKITWGQFFDLVLPLRHAPTVRRHAAAVIISRVQLVSALFAVLVPLFLIFDWIVFPVEQAGLMTLTRLASSVVFVLLAWPWNVAPSRWQAGLMLMTLLLVPPIFYLLTIKITEGVPLSDFGRLVMRLYPLMPNIVLAGLAVFPLSALEVLVFSIPAFLFAIIGLHMNGETVSLYEHGPMLWLMGLVMGVAMFSGMSQLHYIATLVIRAAVDPLTGAYTRRSGGETLDLLFRLSVQQNAPLSVAFLDIDKFKSINDDFGHDEGDKALKTVAVKMREALRVGDLLVRWGGEEFLAIFNNTDAEGAAIVVKRLREMGLGKRPDGKPLTGSIGVAERCADNILDWPQLVDAADRRMYLAKHSGRNRAIMPNGETFE